MIDNVQIIKSRVGILDILAHYQIEPNRAGMIHSICHSPDSKPSTKIYIKQNKIHCFVCNISHDIFGIVQHFEKCDFKSAMERVNEIFNLGLLEPPTDEQKREWAKAQRERERERWRKLRLEKQRKNVTADILEELRVYETIERITLPLVQIENVEKIWYTKAYELYVKAITKIQWLDWLFYAINDFRNIENAERFEKYNLIFGTDSTEILNLLYKKKIGLEVPI